MFRQNRQIASDPNSFPLVDTQTFQYRRFILTAPLVLAMAVCWFMSVSMPACRAQELIDRFEANFEQSEDINFDNWPDRWKRKKGREFPVYSKIEIEPELSSAANSNKVLGMHLDGGNISLVSEPFKIDARFSFHAHANIKTSENSKHPCKAWFTVTFYDAENQNVGEYKSTEISQDNKWNEISIGPILPPKIEGVVAVVGLHLQPTHKTSLFGKAWFDNIWFARVPRIEISNEHHFAVFGYNEPVRMKCRVSGMREPEAQVTMSLLDHDSKVLASEQLELNENSAAEHLNILQNNTNDYVIDWDMDRSISLPLRDRPGFYRLRLELRETGHPLITEYKNFAIFSEVQPSEVSDYGWSIQDASAIESPDDWFRLLRIANVGWLKMPVWHSSGNEEISTKIATMADQMAREGIALIGVLDRPPQGSPLTRIGDSNDIAVMIRNEEAFKLAVNPVLARLALHIRWWQIGSDQDYSLGDDKNASAKARTIMLHFNKYGQHLRIGAPWLWIQKPPDAGKDSWDFIEFADPIPMTAKELETYLTRRQRNGYQSWINLQPLSDEQYQLETTVRDLITRIISAKRFNTPLMMAQPFDEMNGLLNADGSPKKIFVPWKVISTALNQSQYLGQMQLPGGSTNWVFEREGEVMMFVWNESPVTERIYLGQNVQAMDMWGRPVKLESDGAKQLIKVVRMPILVSGLSPELARLRLSFEVDKTKLESIPGIEQVIRIRMLNPFRFGLMGGLNLNNDELFEKKYYVQLRLISGEQLQQHLPIRLNVDAATGRHLLRYDFKTNTGENKHFSIWRPMQIGDEKVKFEVFAELNDKGQMTIRAMLVNGSTSPVNFDCSLYIPERRKLSMDFFNAMPGISRQKMVIVNAEDLKGKAMIFRAREFNGNRALNYRIKIKEP